MFKISVKAKYTSNPIKITKKEGGDPENISGAEAKKLISDTKSDLFSFVVCTASSGPSCESRGNEKKYPKIDSIVIK